MAKKDYQDLFEQFRRAKRSISRRTSILFHVRTVVSAKNVQSALLMC